MKNIEKFNKMIKVIFVLENIIKILLYILTLPFRLVLIFIKI